MVRYEWPVCGRGNKTSSQRHERKDIAVPDFSQLITVAQGTYESAQITNKESSGTVWASLERPYSPPRMHGRA